MKRIVFFISLFLLTNVKTLDAQNHGSDLANLDKFIINQMEQLNEPGFAACIIKGNSVIWSGNYGFANLEDSIAVSDSTLFTVYCVGQPILAACALQLWEDQLLEMDQNVNNILPFQVDNPHFEPDSITARMLLTSTSSISDYQFHTYATIGDPTESLGFFLEQYLCPSGIYYSNNNFFTSQPGTYYKKSVTGYALCGYLAETITGINFNELATTNLFNPLGMKSSARFLNELNIDNLAIGYLYNEGIYQPYPHYGFAAYPSLTLRSTVSELANFVIMLMNKDVFNGNEILDSATVDSMLTVQPPTVSRGFGIGKSQIWNHHGTFQRTVWGQRGGGASGYAGAIHFCPDDNTGVVYLSNTSQYNLAIEKKLFDYAAMFVIAEPALDITQTAFTGTWQQALDADFYFLDLSTDENFGTYLPGFENLDVGSDTSYQITYLIANTDYYYRIRAVNEYDTGAYSNPIMVHTINAGSIIHIPDDYATIQQGIEAANTGDTVLVETGTYYENINFLGKDITVASMYLFDQDTSIISQTIIDGNQNGRVVTFENGETRDALLCGFTITNGTTYGWEGGAGIFCEVSTPTLKNLLVSNNKASAEYAAGISCFSSFPYLEHVIITGNLNHEAMGNWGIGMYCDWNSSAILKNVILSNNVSYTCLDDGDLYFENGEDVELNNVEVYGTNTTGIVIHGGTPILINVKVHDNAAGLGLGGSSPIIINSEFTNNYNRGIGANSSSNILLQNVTIAGNESGLYMHNEGTLINCIVWNNGINLTNYGSISVLRSDIEGGEAGISGAGTVTWLEGNINADPLFIGAGEYPFSLSNESPCVNSGTPDTTGLNLPAIDLAGNPRVYGGRIEMGAYENQEVIVSLDDFDRENSEMNITIHPNPVTDFAILSLISASHTSIEICIYNTTGVCIESWRFQNQQPGQREFTLNLKKIPAGIYFCQVQAGREVIVKKMIKN